MPIEPKPKPASCDSRAVAPRVPHGRAFRMIAPFLLALLPVVALCLLHAPVYATPPDDFVQELFARGQFQAAASSLMPYTLVLVSAPLSALYQLMPQVPWYALMLLAMLVVSFWIAWSQLISLGLSRARLVCLCRAALVRDRLRVVLHVHHRCVHCVCRWPYAHHAARGLWRRRPPEPG